MFGRNLHLPNKEGGKKNEEESIIRTHDYCSFAMLHAEYGVC